MIMQAYGKELIMGLFDNKKNAYEEAKMDKDDFSLRIDLADDDDYYYIYAEVPGKKISDIKMKFKGDKLSLRLVEESDESNPISNKSCIIQERIHDEVERLISFDEHIDKKKVEARLENGLLIVTIKKINPELEEDEDLIIIKS
jgi:HSP20 family protein